MKIFNKYTVRESEMYGINKKIKTVWEKKKFVRWKFNYIYHWKRSLSKILTSKNKLRGGDLCYKCVVAKMRINPKNNENQIRISRKIKKGLVDCDSITLYYKSSVNLNIIRLITQLWCLLFQWMCVHYYYNCYCYHNYYQFISVSLKK